MNKKLLAIGFVLAIIGTLLLAATVYQELVEEPKPEDYHMGIPTAKYKWQSRNQTITQIGMLLVGLGVGSILGGFSPLWKRKS